MLEDTSLLTHCGLVTPCGIDLGQHWFRQWLGAWRHQAITWTNSDLISIKPSGTIFSEILIKIHFHLKKNASENVICKMAAILSRPQCVKSLCSRVPYPVGYIELYVWFSSSFDVVNWYVTGPYQVVFVLPGLILGLRPANERRCYKVTPSLIGWAQT